MSLSLTRWAYRRAARFSLPEDVYDGWVLLAAEEGVFRFEIAGLEAGEARPGDLVLCPPGRTLSRSERSDTLTFWFFEFVDDGTLEDSDGGRVMVRDRARLTSTWAGLA